MMPVRIGENDCGGSNPGSQLQILNSRPREHGNSWLARLDLISVPVVATLDPNLWEAVLGFVFSV